jgi:hypothetical protein
MDRVGGSHVLAPVVLEAGASVSAQRHDANVICAARHIELNKTASGAPLLHGSGI